MEQTKGEHVNELKNEPDLASQIKKIAEHLVFLEKKLDQLLEQSKQKPSFNRFGPRVPYRAGQRNYPPRHTGHRAGGGHYASSHGPRQPHGSKFQKEFNAHQGHR